MVEFLLRFRNLLIRKMSVRKYSVFPEPTGRFKVACTDIMHEPGLLVRLYYPTNDIVPSIYQHVKWLSHQQYIDSYAKFLVIHDADFLSSPYDPTNNPLTPAIYGAPLIKSTSTNEDCTTHPVIVFSHGLGGCRLVYSNVCCDMASHGYVVAAVEHKDRSACASLSRVPPAGVGHGCYHDYVDEWLPYEVAELEVEFYFRNRQVNTRSQEMSQSLDLLHVLNDGGTVCNMMGEDHDFSQFKGRLNLSLTAAMGHSFGGATSLTTLHNDARFKCGVLLDAWMFPVHKDLLDTGIQQPILFINSYVHHKWKANMDKIFKLLKPPNHKGISDSSSVTIKGTVHVNQCDVLFAIPNITKKYQSRLDKYVAYDINSNLSIAFLKRYLLKDKSYEDHIPLLDGGNGAPENIIFSKLDLKSHL